MLYCIALYCIVLHCIIHWKVKRGDNLDYT